MATILETIQNKKAFDAFINENKIFPPLTK